MHHILIIQYQPLEIGHSLFQVQFALSSHAADLPVPKKTLSYKHPTMQSKRLGWLN